MASNGRADVQMKNDRERRVLESQIVWQRETAGHSSTCQANRPKRVPLAASLANLPKRFSEIPGAIQRIAMMALPIICLVSTRLCATLIVSGVRPSSRVVAIGRI